jgi:hypothetical protein
MVSDRRTAMRNLVLLLLATVLVAVALVLALGSGSERDSGLASGAATPGAAQDAERGALVSGAAPDGGDAARSGAVAPPGDAALPPTGAAAAVATGGRARVTGRVVDAIGTPVAGARVTLIATVSAPGMRRATREVLAEMTTGARGVFALDAAAGAHALELEAPRFAPRSEDLELLAGETLDLGDVALDTGVLLAGRVLDPDGAPVSGVRVLREGALPVGMLRLGGEPESPTVDVSDDAGRFRVASQEVGPWRLRFASVEHPEATLEGVTTLGGEVVDDLVVRLEPGATIEGRVVDAPPGDAFEVRALPAEGAGDRVVIDLDGPDGERRAALTEDGRFVARGLRPDLRYRLTLNAVGVEGFGGASHATPVYVAAGARDVELRYSEGASLALRVVDALTGAPLERFTIEGGFEWLVPLAGAEGRTLELHPDGRARFDGLRPREGRARMRIVVAAAGYEIYEREGILLTPEDELDLGTVKLNPMPVLRVHVRDALTGEPLDGARVEARVLDASEGRRVRVRPGGVEADDLNARRGTSDARGLALVSSLPGQRVQLTVRADGYAPWRIAALDLPVTGDVEQEALLDAGARVTLRVVDRAGAPAPGTRVEHGAPFGRDEPNELPGGARGRLTDGAGVALFTMLEPGTHQFRVAPQRPNAQISFAFGGAPSGPGWEHVEVEPGGTHELVLELPRRAELAGVVSEDGEPLAGATLMLHDKDGDPGERALARMIGGGHRARTDSTGRYEFTGLRPGTWLLEVTHPARAMPFEVELRLTEGENERDVALPVSVVEARVLGPDGEPIAGATVRARLDGGRTARARVMIATVDAGAGEASFRMGGESPLAPVVTDEDGRARLRGVTPDVGLVVEATASGFETGRSEVFEVSSGGVRDGVQVVLARGGALVVEVRDGRGDPVPGGFVASLQWQGEPGRRGEPRLAPVQEGRARFEDLAAGRWEVRLQEMAEGAPGADPPAAPQTVEVQPGETASVSFTVK